MLFIKIALWTCAFYLLISLLMELAFLALTQWKGGVLVFLHWWGWAALFAFVWAISFTLGFRVVVGGIQARFGR